MYLIHFDDEVVNCFDENGVTWYRLTDVRAILDAQMPIMFNADTVKVSDGMTFVNALGVERMLKALGESGRDVNEFEEWFKRVGKTPSVAN